jgi:hypothetical protein
MPEMETAYHKGEDFTLSFYTQYAGVAEVVKGLSSWKAPNPIQPDMRVTIQTTIGSKCLRVPITSG